MQNRTSSYQFTVTSLSDPRLLSFKKSVSASNKLAKSTGHVKYRVCTFPRLGENAEKYREYYASKYRGYQMIEVRHGARFDVYMYEDNRDNEFYNAWGVSV